DSTIGIGPELAHVVIRIHGICVNSASVERLWSNIISDDENEEISENVNNDDTRKELIIQSEEQNEDECFLSSEWNNDFDSTGRNMHLADDKIAK
ncbi:14097_t:CDS:2, partial [Funneliformis geosporum]